jgi:DNA-directed RNA polymerase specialized sigma24 family protein
MPLSRRTAFTSAYADGVKTAQGANGDDGVVGELAAVRAARQQLSRREEVAVRRGRQVGLSWAEIGTLLGVTKQTMHRKYRKVG